MLRAGGRYESESYPLPALVGQGTRLPPAAFLLAHRSAALVAPRRSDPSRTTNRGRSTVPPCRKLAGLLPRLSRRATTPGAGPERRAVRPTSVGIAHRTAIHGPS